MKGEDIESYQLSEDWQNGEVNCIFYFTRFDIEHLRSGVIGLSRQLEKTVL